VKRKQQEQQLEADKAAAAARGAAGAMTDKRPPSETSKRPCSADDATEILIPESKVIDTIIGDC
jgi:hypothetical protein